MIKIHLSRLLGEKRMKQAELARQTGIRPTTINLLYREFVDRVSLEHIDRICEVLQCDLSDLMEYVPNSIPKTGNNLIIEQHGRQKTTKEK